MGQTMIQVDAFTDKPFRGNPAAVCFLSSPKDEDWMLKVAAEMNLSETAFLTARGNEFDLRWFTPKLEEELCGHATLASAHVLWEENRLSAKEPAIFHTRSGKLIAKKVGAWITMDFPAEPESQADAPAGLAEALGVKMKYFGRNRLDYLVEVESETEVRNLEVNPFLLSKISTRGVIVTSRSTNSDYDFLSRYIGVKSGIAEDPVTGSAHCCLAPFWSKKLGKDTMVGYQASSRGGVVKVTVKADRVELGGQAVTVLRGELFGI